ncbi:uncharacterized protein LOC117325851 [Pecten maximus]|uniref:uncharacterized protein LOC117325851 n=1 Tax=Pecten maximus TaxID=6579 RepID=UPI0014586724|nr:uncharacterized protein LOC117325851 [Pecten maximus]
MASSSFLFVLRVPAEEENDVNNKDKEAKKPDDGDKVTPIKQDAVRKDSNERSTKTLNIESNDKTDEVKSATLSRSSDVEGLEAPVKPEGKSDAIPVSESSLGTDSLSLKPDQASHIALDIPSTPSDLSASPLPTKSPSQEMSDHDPTSTFIYETDPSIDHDMVTPPPWDFTPPSTPSQTSTKQDTDSAQPQGHDPQDSNQAPEKALPSPAWTFPPSGTLDEETPSIQNATDTQESDSVSEPKSSQSLESPISTQSSFPQDSPSNETSDISQDRVSDTTVDKEGQDVNDKVVDSEEKTPQSGDDSTDQSPPESMEQPIKLTEPVAEKDSDNDNDKGLETFVKAESLFKRTMSVLESYSVKNLSVNKTANAKYFQFMFVEEGDNCEEILNKLAEIGIGDNTQSSISLFETSIYKGTGKVVDEEEEEEALYNSVANPNEQKQSEFKKSIKARMLVTEVVNSVQGNAEFTFDFLLLVLLASSISAMGLVENSSVVLVASMLVSPIMGPILAGTFGTVIQNNTLRNLGIKNEVLSLLICVGMGMVWGLVCGGVCKDGAYWGSTDSWPTSEMKSRGLTRSLWTGILIALPSGAGVALSILGGNTGSLVGVAISASLLPPAVNAGMLWACAIIASIDPPPRVQTFAPPTQTVLNYTVENITQATTTVSELTPSPTLTAGLNCVPFDNNAYVPIYSCDMAEEMLYLGLISLLLTILNIICIIIMGILVLKIKEVAPQVALSEDTKTFWTEDIKIAKASYVTMKGNQSKNLSQQARDLLNEWRKDNGDEPIQLLQLERMTMEIDDDPKVKEIQMRIPGGMRGDLVSRHFADHINKDEEEFEMMMPPQYKTFHALHNIHGHSRKNLFHTSFQSGYYPSPSTSTGSMRRKKVALTEIGEENVPYSADGPIKPKKSPGHFAKAFGILRHPKAGRSNLFRRRANFSKPEEKQIRFAVEKVPDEEVKVQIMKENDNQDVSKPLLERKESV